MTPSLFAGTDAVDEYTFMQTSGAIAKLREHQRSFIREEDFKWIAANGLNAVRIPVGYWIFEGDGPYRSCIGRLDWAVHMATKYNLKVLISLHGAPGSQNGQDHSGHRGSVNWYESVTYQRQTVDVLTRLATRYRENAAVWGIELLNEPLAWRHVLKLRRFYKRAYQAIIAVARPGLVTVFSDGFMPRTMSGVLRAKPGFPVVIDTHWYHFLVPKWLQRTTPLGWNTYIVTWRQRIYERLSRAQPVIVGEWSGIIGGEALNRFPKEQHTTIVHGHARQQVSAYRQLAGWFYWSYKTEARGIFHFRSVIEDSDISLKEL
jgi:glucan 1,3-beta-glucosidase